MQVSSLMAADETPSFSASQSDHPTAPKAKKSRSSRAVKIRCRIIYPEARQCETCAAEGQPCIFPPSRRGRIRGSKNVKTLQRLGQVSTSPSNKSDFIKSSPSSASLHGRNSHITPSGVVAHEFLASMRRDRHLSTTSTSAVRDEIGHEFPLVDDGDDGMTSPCTEDGSPQVAITRLAQRGWNLDQNDHPKPSSEPNTLELPSMNLPPDAAELFAKWTPEALQQNLRDQRAFFAGGLHGSRRDVASTLDPVERGMVSESRADELFTAYWGYAWPQWPMLDPDLHRLSFVRQRSALLTTTILAIGATALATLPEHSDDQVEEALILHTHVERLNILVYMTGARSIEIIQAHILLCRWGMSARTRTGEQRWMRAALIPRMAVEIGLHAKHKHCQVETSASVMLRGNELRTRAFMIINEYRFSAHNGQACMDLSQFELDDSELSEVTNWGVSNPASALPALYHLFLYGREVLARTTQLDSNNHQGNIASEAEYHWIRSYVDEWIKRWCPETEPPSRKKDHLLHEARSHELVFMLKCASRNGRTVEGSNHRQETLDLAERIFTSALSTPTTLHMTHRASVLPVIAGIILRLGDRKDLVLRLALRMAGDPDRPSVPAFTRDAGNQMLAMLCANATNLARRQSNDYSATNEFLTTNGLGPFPLDSGATADSLQPATQYSFESQRNFSMDDMSSSYNWDMALQDTPAGLWPDINSFLSGYDGFNSAANPFIDPFFPGTAPDRPMASRDIVQNQPVRLNEGMRQESLYLPDQVPEAYRPSSGNLMTSAPLHGGKQRPTESPLGSQQRQALLETISQLVKLASSHT